MSIPPNVQMSQQKTAVNLARLQSVSNNRGKLKVQRSGWRDCTRGQQDGTFKGFSMFQW